MSKVDEIAKYRSVESGEVIVVSWGTFTRKAEAGGVVKFRNQLRVQNCKKWGEKEESMFPCREVSEALWGKIRELADAGIGFDEMVLELEIFMEAEAEMAEVLEDEEARKGVKVMDDIAWSERMKEVSRKVKEENER